MSALTWLRPYRLRSYWKLYKAAARAAGPLRAVTDVPRTLRRIRAEQDAMTPAERHEWEREHIHDDGLGHITIRLRGRRPR